MTIIKKHNAITLPKFKSPGWNWQSERNPRFEKSSRWVFFWPGSRIQAGWSTTRGEPKRNLATYQPSIDNLWTNYSTNLQEFPPRFILATIDAHSPLRSGQRLDWISILKNRNEIWWTIISLLYWLNTFKRFAKFSMWASTSLPVLNKGLWTPDPLSQLHFFSQENILTKSQ